MAVNDRFTAILAALKDFFAEGRNTVQAVRIRGLLVQIPGFACNSAWHSL